MSANVNPVGDGIWQMYSGGLPISASRHVCKGVHEAKGLLSRRSLIPRSESRIIDGEYIDLSVAMLISSVLQKAAKKS